MKQFHAAEKRPPENLFRLPIVMPPRYNPFGTHMGRLGGVVNTSIRLWLLFLIKACDVTLRANVFPLSFLGGLFLICSLLFWPLTLFRKMIWLCTKSQLLIGSMLHYFEFIKEYVIVFCSRQNM